MKPLPQFDASMVLDPNTAESSSRHDIPIVAFTSGKGGCGKTTLAVNFANVLAQTGETIMLIDLDLSNRGSTGVFSRWTRRPHENITAARLLRNDLQFGGNCRDLFRIKGNLVFVPAASPEEKPWIEPERPSLREFVAEIRSRLLELADKCGAACIVIDCFCGVDLLTTAASSIADHTLLINEPDIITFTGTTNLVFHLKRAFKSLQRKPRLHIIVNRMRYTQTVQSLSALYRHNLQEIMEEPVLSYFPYHPRIYENFGEYAFASDLLPRSLFVKKLKLVAWELFGEHFPKLVPPPVEKWSQRKMRRIYFRSIDSSAVNSEYLLLRFTRFPLLLGFWFLFRFLVLGAFPLTPNAAWSLRILLEILLWIIAIPLLHGTWLAARLNFSLAALRARLGRLVRSRWEKSYHFATSVTALAAGALMAVAMLGSFGWMASNVYFLTQRFGFVHGGQPTNTERRRIEGLLRGRDIRILRLAGGTFTGLHLFNHHFTSNSRKLAREDLFGYQTEILVGAQTNFVDCELDSSVLLPNRNSQVTFKKCVFSRSWRWDEPLVVTDRVFEDCTFRREVFANNATIRNATFKNCTFITDSRPKIRIEKSRFDGCVFNSSFFEKIRIQESFLTNCEFAGGAGGLFWIDDASIESVELSVSKGPVIIFANGEIKNSSLEFNGNTRIAVIECAMGGTQLRKKGSDPCLLYAPSDIGIEINPADFEVIRDEKEFLTRLKPEPTLQEKLEAAQEKLQRLPDKNSREYRFAALDLVELEILANTDTSRASAKQRLAETLQSARDAQDLDRIVSGLLLNVVFTIVTSDPKTLDMPGSLYQNALAEWRAWWANDTWKRYRAANVSFFWNWAIWDRYARVSLNQSLTIQQLKAVEDIKASAIREGISRPSRADGSAKDSGD